MQTAETLTAGVRVVGPTNARLCRVAATVALASLAELACDDPSPACPPACDGGASGSGASGRGTGGSSTGGSSAGGSSAGGSGTGGSSAGGSAGAANGGTASGSAAGGGAASGGTAGAGSSDAGAAGGPSGHLPTDPDLLVAFIGDQGNGAGADAVLRLIAAEGAAAVVHSGDFDYEDDPDAWDARIDAILGRDYPYFATIGNHDAAAWEGSDGYAEKIAARHARVPDMGCSGELGVQATCRFRGLHLVQSCIGTKELRPSCAANSTEAVHFIRSSLENDAAIFSVCSWHENQHDMQVGFKDNAVGWDAYQQCMTAGAIIATGHEHSYARTLALTALGDAALGHGATGAPDALEIGANRTFVFVSGLAGKSIRNYLALAHADDTWWASYYAGNRWLKNGALMTGTADHGALFIRFHVDGDPRRARAYFKDVRGRLADEFTITVRQ